MRNPNIDTYVEKYYGKWYRYARWFCSRAGIYPEAYDIFTDTLVDILGKDDLVLTDLIAEDQIGNPYFYNYVRRALTFKIAKASNQKRKWLVESIDADNFYANNLREIPRTNEPLLADGLFDEMREIESRLRDDCFVSPIPTIESEYTSDNNVKVYVFMITPQVVLRKNGQFRPCVNYATEVYIKGNKVKRRCFQSKGLAMCWALQNRSNIDASKPHSLCKPPQFLTAL